MRHIQIRRFRGVLGIRRLRHVRPKRRSSMLLRTCCQSQRSLFPWPTFQVDLLMHYQDILDTCHWQHWLGQSCIGRQLGCLYHCRRSMIQRRCMWPFCQQNQHLITVIIRSTPKTDKKYRKKYSRDTSILQSSEEVFATSWFCERNETCVGFCFLYFSLLKSGQVWVFAWSADLCFARTEFVIYFSSAISSIKTVINWRLFSG